MPDELADDTSLEHDHQAVGERHRLVQVLGDQQDAGPAAGRLHQQMADGLDGAHVQAAGGLHCHQQLGVFVDLTGNDRLLLVAAGHAAHDGSAALAAAHVILGDQLIGVLPHLFTADKAVVLELGLPVALKHHIVFQDRKSVV